MPKQLKSALLTWAGDLYLLSPTPRARAPPPAGFPGFPNAWDCLCVLICLALFRAWSPQKECLGWEWGQGWFLCSAKSR